MLGLPDRIRACLFDLDGVLTKTALVHRAAWRETFDGFLRNHCGPDFRPFSDADYYEFVDGKPRFDGVRDFLASRDIHLPEGEPDDPPTAETVAGVGNRKNELLLRRLDEDGVEVFEDSVRYVHAARQAGLHTAVVTASANAETVLRVTGLEGLFEARIDGVVAARQGLAGKPAPDTFLAGARALGVGPEAAAVFEDAIAGVEAGQAGGFGFVVGVDRTGEGDALRAHGADIVVKDLSELMEDG
jgi:beta-phosphoglucomutase family hydrolase